MGRMTKPRLARGVLGPPASHSRLFPIKGTLFSSRSSLAISGRSSRYEVRRVHALFFFLLDQSDAIGVRELQPDPPSFFTVSKSTALNTKPSVEGNRMWPGRPEDEEDVFEVS